MIRPASEADLPRLLVLLQQLSVLGEKPSSSVAPLTAAEHSALQALLADPRFACMVLDVGGQVVGTLTYYVLPNLSHGARPMAVIENVVVDEAERGKGYGRLLMEHAERAAAGAGCYKITLTSNRRRLDAHRFYAGIGYQPTHQGFTKYLD